MKWPLSLVILASAIFHQVGEAKVIYGEDHRLEVSEGNPIQRKASLSTATMIHIKDIAKDPQNSSLVNITQKTLKEWLETMDTAKNKVTPKLEEAIQNGMSFCATERFTDQPNPGMCSGFLIAHDLIVTAGHCVELEKFCEEYKWVFGFQMDPKTKKAGVGLNENNVYSCKRVVSHALNMSLGLDYGIIQLDRSVSDRTPLNVRTEKQIEDLSGLFVIGSPSGLPLKVAGGASVRTNTHPFYFVANLDTFQGNSGSAVFNATTGNVEGILVRGENDFVPNSAKKCIEANKCKDNECRGEDITRTTAVPEIGAKAVLDGAAISGDLENLKKILDLNIWVDIYLKDGKSAFMKAVTALQVDAAKILLEKGADINLRDAVGNTALHLLAINLKREKAELLNLLKSAKSNFEIRNNAGETALHMAAKVGNKIAAKMLIEHGAEKNALDNNGETILFKFARLGDLVSVINFADMGVDINLKSASGESVTTITREMARRKKLKKPERLGQ